MATVLDHRGEPADTTRRETLAQLKTTINDLKRERIRRLAGLQYDDDRDVWKVAGYPEQYTFTEGFSRYERQHIAGRIVDMPAQTTWRNEPTVREPGSDPEEDTEFEAAWQTLFTDHRLSHHWERLDRMAGIGEFAIQLLGFDDISNARQLRQPIGEPGDVNRLLFVSQFKQEDVEIAEWDDGPGSENFGRPLIYDVNLSGDVSGFTAGNQRVHHSRVIHLADSPLDDEVFGRPRLRRVLNLLIDLEKITAATGESYWQEAVPILIGNVDPEAQGFADNKEDLEEDLQKIVHDLRRHFLGQGIELEKLGGSTPDPSDPTEMLKTLIAAAAGIPKRILFGSERGELASSQDTREWLGRIAERQTRLAEPQVVRPFTDTLIAHDVLPEPRDGYEVVWPNLFEHSESERAEIDATKAKTVKSLVAAIFQGGESARRIASELIPEVAEVLEQEQAELRRFMEEEDSEAAAEVERLLSENGGEPSELEIPDALIERGT